MKTRKQLFDAKKMPSDPSLIPTTVSFKLDRPNGRLHALKPTEKLVCALRRVLAEMSRADGSGCRYYLDGENVQLLSAPTSSEGKPGEAKTYRASGRAKVGVCHPQGHKSSKLIQFKITFRDTKDNLGLDDVSFLGDTIIEELPRDTPLDTRGIA